MPLRIWRFLPLLVIILTGCTTNNATATPLNAEEIVQLEDWKSGSESLASSVKTHFPKSSPEYQEAERSYENARASVAGLIHRLKAGLDGSEVITSSENAFQKAAQDSQDFTDYARGVLQPKHFAPAVLVAPLISLGDLLFRMYDKHQNAETRRKEQFKKQLQDLKWKLFAEIPPL